MLIREPKNFSQLSGDKSSFPGFNNTPQNPRELSQITPHTFQELRDRRILSPVSQQNFGSQNSPQGDALQPLQQSANTRGEQPQLEQQNQIAPKLNPPTTVEQQTDAAESLVKDLKSPSEDLYRFLLKASILTPEQQEEINTAGKLIKHTFIETNRPFIPQHTLQELEAAEDRIVVMDRKSFETLHRVYDELTIGEVRSTERVMGTYFPDAKLMAFPNPYEIWDFTSPEVKESLIKQFGSEERAKKIEGLITLFDNLAHEIVHQFEDHSLPIAFRECAVRYYQRETVKKFQIGYAKEEFNEERIKFYENQVQKYGEDVHKLFFGSEIDAVRKQTILAELSTEEINRLFPNGSGL